jgi:hypothetical protein
MAKALAENALLKIVLLTILTLLAAVFLRLLSQPSRNPFKPGTYTAMDVDIGAELGITAWASYLVGIAERLNAPVVKTAEPMSDDKVIAIYLISAILIISAILTPVYVRLCTWNSLPRKRYQPTLPTVWVPNVIGFLTLTATAYLLREIH